LKQIVDYEKDALSPAHRVQAVQLDDDLRGRLGARAMPEQRRHIAKLATEGAASGELDTDRIVVFEIRQRPKRHGGVLDIRKLGRGIHGLSTAVGQVCQEGWQSQLGFVEHKVVHIRESVMFHGKERPARHHLHPGLLAASNQCSRRIALHDHSTDKDIVGPRQVLLGQAGHIEVNQPFFPVGRQHSRYGQKAEWRCAGLFADKLERVFETPERVWKLGVDQ